MATWVPFKDVHGNFRPRRFLAGAAITYGTPVEVYDDTGTKKVKTATAGNSVRYLGVAAETIASGSYGTIWTRGVFYIASGNGDSSGTITPGTKVTWKTGSQVTSTIATNKVAIGQVSEAASTAAGDIYVELISDIDEHYAGS